MPKDVVATGSEQNAGRWRSFDAQTSLNFATSSKESAFLFTKQPEKPLQPQVSFWKKMCAPGNEINLT